MDRNLTWKIVLIIVLVVVAAWTLYPPEQTLKPGLDLAGGTSLIYEIDPYGLEDSQVRGLAEKMITVLRRRVDPASMRNLVWRPYGNTRFEIQMPLSTAEARQKRLDFENAQARLLDRNINTAVIIRSLVKPTDLRHADFEKFAAGSAENLQILNDLADTWDRRTTLRAERDGLFEKLQHLENSISSAGVNLEMLKNRRDELARYNQQQLDESIKDLLALENESDPNQQPQHLQTLTDYVNTYADWKKVVSDLTDPDTGGNIRFRNAKRELDKLNLSADQLNSVLEMPAHTPKRAQAIEQLKAQFEDLAADIDKTVKTFDTYSPFRGRLDDPRDLQRLLKGAGILEFRILPTQGHPKVDPDEISYYVDLLKAKGPTYASDNKYVWCQLESFDTWKLPNTFVAPFGDKYYVLASNKANEVMLHQSQKDWKLEKAAPGRQSQTGQRAIDFVLDERGGKLFGNVTAQNIDRPLCILLDGLAISAPNVQSRITTNGQITGNFSATEVADMVDKLNAGSLPARLIEQPIGVKSIGPSLGADNRDKGITAVIIGLVTVVTCMLVYYTLAGTIADLALCLNLLFILAVMALVRATFTLPGIAGIILTIGMSVDANVLIFERIREEQRRGCSLRIAIKNGYERAFRTILDANLTTFIPAAILLWMAPEEVKGFAIVLILGILSSMFTALFVTRVVFDYLLAKKIIKNPLFMLSIIRSPNINWMRARPVFLTISVLLIAGGLFVFFTRDDRVNNKYDIEFTGGTSVQINLKDSVSLTRQQVEDRINKTGNQLGNPGLAAANVYSIGKSNDQYEIITTETNRTTVTVTFPDAEKTVEAVTAAIKNVQARFRGRLNNLQVTQQPYNPAAFVISTSQVNVSLVKSVLTAAFANAQISEPKVDEVVNNAILAAFDQELEIQQNLQPQILSTEKISEQLVDSYPELTDFLGGIKVVCNIKTPAAVERIDQRLRDLRFKPAYQSLRSYQYHLLGPNLAELPPETPVNSFVYLSLDPEAGTRQLTEDEWTAFVENETAKVLAATEMETSLPRITQTDPSIGGEQKTRAIIAIVLSLFAIVGFIWVRFGNARYGFAAIIALVHDVLITGGAVVACTYIANSVIGQKLLIGDFKINLAMIAAFLTLIGYSLNDTIVIFDRIRENRSKRQLTAQIITDSINQTLSRTILTSFTTFIVVLIMYIFGGQALRGFAFAICFGVIIGTYSSIAIAAPILLLKTRGKQQKAQM